MYSELINTVIRMISSTFHTVKYVLFTGISTNSQYNQETNTNLGVFELSSTNSSKYKLLSDQNCLFNEILPHLQYNMECERAKGTCFDSILKTTNHNLNVGTNETLREDNRAISAYIPNEQELSLISDLCASDDEIYSLLHNLDKTIGDIDNGIMLIDDELDYPEADENLKEHNSHSESLIASLNLINDEDVGVVSSQDENRKGVPDLVNDADDTISADILKHRDVAVDSIYCVNRESSDMIDRLDGLKNTLSSELEISTSVEPCVYESIKQFKSTVSGKRLFPNANESTSLDHNYSFQRAKRHKKLVFTENTDNRSSYSKNSCCLNKTTDTLWELTFSLNDEYIIYQYNPNISTSFVMEYLGPGNYKIINENELTNSRFLLFSKIRTQNVSFSFPVYTLLKFESPGNLKFLKLNIVSNLNSLNLVIRGTVYLTEMGPICPIMPFFLKNITAYDLHSLFNNLIDEEFPIYDFSNLPHNSLIRFEKAHLYKYTSKMKMRDYFKELPKIKKRISVINKGKTKNPNIKTFRSNGKRQSISWKTSSCVLIDYIHSFIIRIQMIIRNLKNTDLNSGNNNLRCLTNGIIYSIKYQWDIISSHNRDDLYLEEETIISMYIFLNREVKTVLEYWMIYFLSEDEVKYVNSRTLLEEYLLN